MVLSLRICYPLTYALRRHSPLSNAVCCEKEDSVSNKVALCTVVFLSLGIACGSGYSQTQAPTPVAQAVPDEQRGSQLSMFSPNTPATPVPCAARADAVIANAGRVFSLHHSLVDSYKSTLGDYGGSNRGDDGNVRAAEWIVRRGGIIHGHRFEKSPAGLMDIAVPNDARPLPLNANYPGHLLIHDEHDSITLRPGNYVAEDVDVQFPGAIHVFPVGLVSIFVKGHLYLDGHENLHGDRAQLQFIVTGEREVHVGRFGTLVGLIYAPRSAVELHSKVFGSVIGRSVEIGAESAVHYDQSLACSATPPTSPAIAPSPLPPPPPPVEGCYVYTRNGWQSTPCATQAFIDANFPHPDAQITISTPTTPPLVFGQLEVTIPQVTSESNAFLASTAGIPGCTSSGSPEANEWSVQNNTNGYTIPGTNPPHTAANQFAVQNNGSTSGICIWSVDVTAQKYTTKCVPTSPQQRTGGLQAFDSGNIAAFANGNGTLTIEAAITWVPPGQPNIYSTVGPDTYGLTGNWSQVSGGFLGEGACSQAQLTNAEVITQVLASTCVGDTQAGNPACAPPLLQPNATVAIGGNGTVETSNLVPIGQPSLSYLNSDLVVSNQTSTTSGNCLGPSHAYVQDSPEDFGATPSTIGDQVFWESPDIFLVPHGTPVDLTAVSTETTITPGGNFDVWVRVHNDLGCSDVDNVKTLTYLADPSALSVQWTPITGTQYVGDNGSSTGVTVPAGGEALIGPLPFTAPTTGLGDGHKCVLAAIEGNGEPAPANSSDAPDSNQVAQRNMQFVGPCAYPLSNATTSAGNAQITLSVTPITGTPPSLTALPDVEATFDDADSSWFNVWQSAPGNGTTYSVTHSSSANTSTIRLGTFSVALAPVPLSAGQTRNMTAAINPASGSLTLQIEGTLTGPGNQVLVTNGGSCVATAPVIQ